MKKYNVYAMGNAMVDYEIEIDDKFLKANDVEKGLMTLVDEARQSVLLEGVAGRIKKKQGGGSAANSAIAIGQLGGSVFYSCKVANDEDGQLYKSDLSASGVDTNLDGKTLAEGVTGKCLVMISPDADRTMNTFLGITSDYSVAEINEKALKASEYLFIEGYLVSNEKGVEAMLKAKDIAEKNGVKTSLTFSDPSMVKYFRDGMAKVVGTGVDLLFCNEEEAKLFTGTDSFEEAVSEIKKIATQFAITRGDKGAYLFDGDKSYDIKPVPTRAIDTTGAGDMFSGAFLFAITNGYSFEEAGNLSSRASSAVVSKFGPRLDNRILQELK